MSKLLEHVKGQAFFQYYIDGNLWYKTDSGLEFPIPIDDTKGARFLAQDKSSIFMRWIRKHLQTIEKGNQEVCILQGQDHTTCVTGSYVQLKTEQITDLPGAPGIIWPEDKKKDEQ